MSIPPIEEQGSLLWTPHNDDHRIAWHDGDIGYPEPQTFFNSTTSRQLQKLADIAEQLKMSVEEYEKWSEIIEEGDFPDPIPSRILYPEQILTIAQQFPENILSFEDSEIFLQRVEFVKKQPVKLTDLAIKVLSLYPDLAQAETVMDILRGIN